MVEEILVKDILSDAMVRVGAELIRVMKQKKVVIDVAAWIYSDESKQWRLVFASPDVNSQGSRSALRRIQSVLAQMPDFPLSFMDTSVKDSNEPLVRALHYAIQNRDVRYGVRLTREMVQRIYIDDAYVYSLSAVMGTEPAKTSANGAARYPAAPTEYATRA